MNRCVGCGAILQNDFSSKEGFVANLDDKFCKRCFDIKHYNKYVKVPYKDYGKVISDIDKKNDLILLVSDFLNLYNLEKINFKSPVLLVVTKADLIPRNIKNFSSKIKLPVLDEVVVSSKNNYNFDLLYEKILKYKTSSNVYVVGFTNAGKSTLVNKLLKNYGNDFGEITVSNLPSTTVDFISNRVNDNLVLVDTPGLLDFGSLMLKVDKNGLKKIMPKKEIRPIIYQIKKRQSLCIDDFVKITFLSQSNIVIYMSNGLNFQRKYKNDDLKGCNLNIRKNQKLIIKGLGFIEFKMDSSVNLELIDGVEYLIN